MTAHAVTDLVLVGAALLAAGWVLFDLTIHPSSSLLRRAWRCIHPDTSVEGILAAAAAEMRSGCDCPSCEQLRDLVLQVQSRITERDRAVLAEIGVTWEGGSS